MRKMPYRTVPFVDLGFYHIYNRGVEKRSIFSNDRDYQRFLQTLFYYQFSDLKFRFSRRNSPFNKNFQSHPKSVEVICYCLMPNHFHLLVRQLKEGGVHKFMQKTLNSYTKYFNTKYGRVGPLLQGAFRAIPVETDLQLMHVSRYIHLNPYASELTEELKDFPYSSYRDFIEAECNSLCYKQPVMDFFKDAKDYEEFVVGRADFARELEAMKHLLMEEE